MPVRLAILGFRHGHIMSVYKEADQRADIEIVATCEDDEATRTALVASGTPITHTDWRQALAESDCDAVAVGDYYGRRGEIALAALQASKHVILDKPVCTSLSELEQIASLACSGNLSVGCQLDLRASGKFQRLRDLVLGNRIGEIHAISFGGQHPLNYGSRPSWYFEDGKHGGTINDIAIHAIDIIPWLTGLKFRRIDAARNWNAACHEVPHFRDAAQMMMTMDNHCGVLGDVSYLSPNSIGYSLPMYWRVTLWGSQGVAEVDSAHDGILLYAEGARQAEELAPLPGGGPSCFGAFVQELQGETKGLLVTTAEVLSASRVTLKTQEAADNMFTAVNL